MRSSTVSTPSAAGTSSRRRTQDTGRFTRDNAGSQTLERGLLLLRAFRAGTTFLSNAELAARTGLPRPTVSRLTHSLVDAGFLRYDLATRAYRLAPVVLSLADAFVQSTPVPRQALLAMQDLAEAERVNVGLAIGDQTEMVYVVSIRHSGDSVSRTRRVAPGTRVPMDSATIGLAWLAMQTPAVRDELLGRIAARAGARWAREGSGILRRIAQAQRQGYCAAPYQYGHLAAVGTAFTGVDGEVYGLNISYPQRTGHGREDSLRYGGMLLALAGRMELAAVSLAPQAAV